MSEQRDQPHFGFEWQSDRLEVNLAFITIVVQEEFGMLG
jgi:hypothetical protein